MTLAYLTDFLNLLFPPACVHCRHAVRGLAGGLCPSCTGELSECLVPDAELPAAAGHLLDAMVLWYYRPGSPVRSLHRAIKFEGQAPCGRAAGRALGTRVREQVQQVDAVVPLPSHPVRIAERGFHHMVPVAKGVASALGVPMKSDLLVRTRLGASQTNVSSENRAANVSASFRVDGRGVKKNSEIVLVDDVITSGATMFEAGSVLSEAGFSVICAALAIRREPPPGIAWRGAD